MGHYGDYVIIENDKDFFKVYNQILSKGKDYYLGIGIYPETIYRLGDTRKAIYFHGDNSFFSLESILGFHMDQGLGVNAHAFNEWAKELSKPIKLYAGSENPDDPDDNDNFEIIADFEFPSSDIDGLKKYTTEEDIERAKKLREEVNAFAFKISKSNE